MRTAATLKRCWTGLSTLGLAGTLCLITSCNSGGSGGSTSSFDKSATLLAVLFPDPNDVNPEDATEPPAAAPLVQQVQLVFDGRPDPDRVNSRSIAIVSPLGVPVPGTFEVVDRTVTFTPRLPTRPAVKISNTDFDNGGAGLAAGTQYSIRLGQLNWDFIEAIAPALEIKFGDPNDPTGILLQFTTTTKLNQFFAGLEKRKPRIVATSPEDGAVGVTPELYSDPDGLFDERRSFFLTFDAPLQPSDLNLNGFQLVDVNDKSVSPSGLPLGIDVRLVSNELDECVVEVTPSGILPFGHLLALEHPLHVRGLSQHEDPGPGSTVASVFTVAKAPDDVRDQLSEDFDDKERQLLDATQLQVGELPAAWDERDSNVLQAVFAFQGFGELGEFNPFPPEDPNQPRTLVFDTNRMSFPLYDGSTPDAAPGTEIIGGVFPFTDINIPDGIIIEVRGSNPLVFTATGTIRIGGEITARGTNGTHENAYDSAVTSVPGGPGGSGGGRGGHGHPIHYWPADDISNLTLVSPAYGGRGWGPKNEEQIGGIGGQCGILDHAAAGQYGTDQEINCQETSSQHNNGYKTPGGGGGSMLNKGRFPNRDGIGNVLADGKGGFLVRGFKEPDFDVLDRGPPGLWPFSDGDPLNNFIGVQGEYQVPFGGQGGGSGGSTLDSYYCGAWCQLDSDPNNDQLCEAEFSIPPVWADSVGDSRGAGGGGGGGVVVLQALGKITLENTCDIYCQGGTGGGGEMLGCGAWSGSGGGGSGGAVLAQSAINIKVNKRTTINVDRGGAGLATAESGYAGGGCPGARRDNTIGAGGYGSVGIIQLQVPINSVPNVDPGADLTWEGYVDQSNTLNPSAFTAISVAISDWFDMGRMIQRPPEGTNPVYRFKGLDAEGKVITDLHGNVPETTDIHCDYLGQLDPLDPGHYLPGEEPRSDFIPPNATVTVLFQGAQAITPGSKEVDPASLTAWSPDVAIADGMQFVRYKVVFDIAADGKTLAPTTPRPTVQQINIHADF